MCPPALGMAALMASSASAQGRACQMQVDHVAREGLQTQVGGSANYFAGGDVRLSCRGQPVHIWSDSLA